MTQTKRELDDLKRKKDLEEIKRKKIAETKYRQEILRKVEEAKQDRARKFGYSSSSPSSTPDNNNNNNNSDNKNNNSSNSNNNNNSSNSSTEYTTCEIVIRYQGQEMKNTFKAEDTMGVVYSYVKDYIQGNRSFSLIAGYPKVTFSPQAGNLNLSLRDASSFSFFLFFFYFINFYYYYFIYYLFIGIYKSLFI